MKSQPKIDLSPIFDTVPFDTVPFDTDNELYSYEDWADDQAADEYEFLCQIAADLEEMLDDQQCEYMSDLQLTSDQYTALDRIRNASTVAQA